MGGGRHSGTAPCCILQVAVPMPSENMQAFTSMPYAVCAFGRRRQASTQRWRCPAGNDVGLPLLLHALGRVPDPTGAAQQGHAASQAAQVMTSASAGGSSQAELAGQWRHLAGLLKCTVLVLDAQGGCCWLFPPLTGPFILKVTKPGSSRASRTQHESHGGAQLVLGKQALPAQLQHAALDPSTEIFLRFSSGKVSRYSTADASAGVLPEEAHTMLQGMAVTFADIQSEPAQVSMSASAIQAGPTNADGEAGEHGLLVCTCWICRPWCTPSQEKQDCCS